MQAALRDCAVGCFDWDPFAVQLPFTAVMMRQNVETMTEEAFASLDPVRQAARDIVTVPLVVEPNAARPVTAPRRRARSAPLRKQRDGQPLGGRRRARPLALLEICVVRPHGLIADFEHSLQFQDHDLEQDE